MFRELMPLIESRPLSITVAVLTGGLIRVNVVPQQLDKDSKVNDKIGYSNKEKIAKIPESAIYALTTPLSLTGTPEEIDESLPQALTHFAESHVRLQNTVDDARNQIAEAVRPPRSGTRIRVRRRASAGGPPIRKRIRNQDRMNSCHFGVHRRARRQTRARTTPKRSNRSLVPWRNPFQMVNNPNSKRGIMESHFV